MVVRVRHLLCAAVLAAGAVPAAAAAAPTDLDPAFSGDGIVTTNLGGTDEVSDVLAQADGRTLVAVGSGGKVGLARYLTNGTPDKTFSGDGIVLTTIPQTGGPWIPGGAAMAPSGRLLLSAENQEGDVVAVVRYLANGKPDTAFNGDGIAFTSAFREQQHCGARPDVAVGADLRPLVAFGGGNGFCSWDAARLKTNGTLDVPLSEEGQDFAFAFETAVLPDGRLLVMGSTGNDGNLARVFRYLPDGSPDLSFGFEGQAVTGTDVGDIGRNWTVDRQGRILAAGTGLTADGELHQIVARLLSDGTPDESFGPSGVAPVDFGEGGFEPAGDLAVAPDGRIVEQLRFDWRLATLLDGGTRDASFDPAATARANAGPRAVDLQPDGRIVAAGVLGGDVFLARYLGTPTLCGGKPVTRYGAGTIGATPGNDVVLGSDGRDTISGAGGNDTICSGAGNDVVHGGSGVDRLEGGTGKDFLYGDAGTDTLLGGDDGDRLDGGTEADTLLGEAGDDNLFGGSGTDACDGDGGTDTGSSCESTSSIP